MKSDVYFIRIDSTDIEKRESALKRLIDTANPFSNYKDGEFIPVKVTIGDSPCVYHLQPQLVKLIISAVKKEGAKPFLFDTSVIYKGQRQNAVDHLNLAQSKGFGHSKAGAPFIIADGIFGQDGKEWALNSPNIKKIRIPSFIGLLDSLLVLSHVTGHIVSGYAGAIKNVAMGMSCRATKQVQHSSLKPSIIEKNCTACGCCMAICPAGAISFKNKKIAFGDNLLSPVIGDFRSPSRFDLRSKSGGGLGKILYTFLCCKKSPADNNRDKKQSSQTGFINQELCVGCGECLCACKFNAIFINWHEDPNLFCRRMAETADFILSKFEKKIFLNFAFDITQECDCISTKDEKMISGDLGILASNDILSIDKATADLVNKNAKSDFLNRTRNTYTEMFEYAAKTGLGNLEYNLIEIS
ncbi:MAG: DUF362 domain-containing protein [Candidatus Omnitrophota bacterium]